MLRTMLAVDGVTGSDEWHHGIIHTNKQKEERTLSDAQNMGMEDQRMESRKRKRSCPRIQTTPISTFGPVRSVRKLSWCRADLGKSAGKVKVSSRATGPQLIVDKAHGSRRCPVSKGVNAQTPVPNPRGQPTYFRHLALWFKTVSRAAVSSRALVTAFSPIIESMPRSKEEEKKATDVRRARPAPASRGRGWRNNSIRRVIWADAVRGEIESAEPQQNE